MRKHRADSKLWTLPQDVQDRIWEEWSVLTLQELAEWCAEELGLSTSRSALSEYAAKRLRLEKLERMRSSAEDFKAFLQNRPDVTPEQVEEYAQTVFEIQAASADSPAEYIEMQKLKLAKETAEWRAEIEAKRLELSERRVAVMESKREEAREKVRQLIEGGDKIEGDMRDTILQEVDALMGIQRAEEEAA